MLGFRGLTSSSAKLRLAALAALIIFGAVAAFAHTERADAEFAVTYNTVCSQNGYWTVSGLTDVQQPKGSIRCDVAKPGWIFDLSTPTVGDTRWTYDGDRVSTPVCVHSGGVESGGCEYGQSAYRLIPTEIIGTPRPPVDQSLAHGTQFEGFTYTADDANRAVRGDDGHCYREERIMGQWQRSISYGTDEDACRQASWQAYHVSVNNRLLVSIPSGRPLGELLRTAAVPQEPEMYVRWVIDDEARTGTSFAATAGTPGAIKTCQVYDSLGNYRGRILGGSAPCPGGSIIDDNFGRPLTEHERRVVEWQRRQQESQE